MAVEQPCNALHAGLRQYFMSSKFTDATIHCGDKKFKVHKVVLGAQSNYFSKAFDGHWKEAVSSTIELKEDEVSIVEAMLEFMYRFDYDAGGSDQDSVSPLIFHAKVYSIADKYEVLVLKSQAREKFAKLVRTSWDMDDFPYAITEIYSSTYGTDRGLRDLVVGIVCEHIYALLEKQDFHTVLEETLGFAADVTRLIAKYTKNVRCYKCPYCFKIWEAVLSSGAYCCLGCGTSRADWEHQMWSK